KAVYAERLAITQNAFFEPMTHESPRGEGRAQDGFNRQRRSSARKTSSGAHADFGLFDLFALDQDRCEAGIREWSRCRRISYASALTKIHGCGCRVQRRTGEA